MLHLPFRPFLCLVTLALASSPLSTRAAPDVHTSNYPLHYFAERIAGDRIDLHFLAPADGDPAFWTPSGEAIAKMQTADLLLLNGATYEKWLMMVSLPESIQVDTTMDLAAWFIEIEDATTHSHGKEGEHSHAGTAFTTWLDFQQARQQAEAVHETLADLLPEAADALAENAGSLIADLNRLDEDTKEVAASIGDQPLMASHPVYQYFARQYELDIESVLWEPETVPDDEAMAALQKRLAKHPAQWMIWEGEPARESVVKLKAIGVNSVVFDPCGNRPEEGDFLSVMQENIEQMRTIAEAAD